MSYGLIKMFKLLSQRMKTHNKTLKISTGCCSFLLKPTKSMLLCGSLSPRHGASCGCGWRRRPSDMEGSCECIE